MAKTTLIVNALPVGTVIGTWRVVRKLGAGGFGVVYQVEDTHHPGEFQALKLALHLEDKRAEREVVLLMSRAIHPNVVRFHACGRWPHPTQGFSFFVMDWVPGPPLHLWAEWENPSFRRFADQGARLARALGALHARGVLHRDVKPEHILIREADGEPILVDLGAGDFEGADSLTSAALPPGTPHLRSPEALRFWMSHVERPRERYQPTPADDLYALGASLYRALTGHFPFSPGLPSDVLALYIVHQSVLAPSLVNPRVPRALSDVVLRLLAKKPEERYASGEELAEALTAAAAFGKPAEWDASLFAWEEVPPQQGEGPMWRRIRRPDLPAQPPLLPPPSSSELVVLPPQRGRARRPRGARPEPEFLQEPARASLPWRQALGLGGVLALVAGMVVLGAMGWPRSAPTLSAVPLEEPLASAREEAPPPPLAPAPVPLNSPVMEPEQEKSVNKQSPQKSAGKSQQNGGSVGKTLGATLTCVGLACSSAQVRPSDADCAPEARAAMQSLGIDNGDIINVITDFHQYNPKGKGREHLVRSGPITSRTEGYLAGLPYQTIMEGQLFVVGQVLYGRYDRARTPGGQTYPVCFRVYADTGLDITRPGPEPDTLWVPWNLPLEAVERFQFR